MLNAIMSFLGGGFLKIFGNTILQPILTNINNTTTAEKEVAIATIQAQIETNRIKAALAPEFKWLIHLLVLPVAIHFGAVFLDSVPLFGHVVGAWQVPALPAPYDDYEGKIILSFFALQPTATLVKGVSSWLNNKGR